MSLHGTHPTKSRAEARAALPGGYQDPPSLSPHIRYFVARCMAKGAARAKAERWAQRQVREKGKRAPR